MFKPMARTTNREDAGSFARRAASWAVVLAVCCAANRTADGRTFSLQTQEDPDQISAFMLDFGELGGVSSGLIARTDYELELDPRTQTGQFVSYRQEVEPLTLPGGFSTGNIIVEVVPGSSVGTFDPVTGEFTTNEVYAVHFEGDLSAFGLESPVFLPSSSTGTIGINPDVGGTVGMAWRGSGELPSPFDPQQMIQFTYTCEVNTVFALHPDLLVRLSLMPEVMVLELPTRIENGLLVTLERSAARLEAGRDAIGAFLLRSFVREVERNRRIPADGAASLVIIAEDIIDMVKPVRDRSGR